MKRTFKGNGIDITVILNEQDVEIQQLRKREQEGKRVATSETICGIGQEGYKQIVKDFEEKYPR
jgi:hypothetical protein